MTIRFHLDEHISEAVARGLRVRGIDVTTSIEAGLKARPDEEHLAFGVAQQRVVVTHDDDFLVLHAAGLQYFTLRDYNTPESATAMRKSIASANCCVRSCSCMIVLRTKIWRGTLSICKPFGDAWPARLLRRERF